MLMVLIVFSSGLREWSKAFGVAMRFLHPALNSRYVAVLPAMALSLLWIVLVESRLYLKDPAVTTADFIKSTDKLVQNHVRAWGEVPAGMNELRLFAKQTYNRYATFDVWGERLEYLRLGKINYTIRSFGADGLQNRPGGLLDPGVFRWGQLEKLGLRYDADEGVKQARPSVVLFAGADDSTANWHAKIFVDPISGMRRLLVRDRRERRFYMIAPHDGVEEFLWVPGQEKIVFTATPSARYDDGVYLWDLRSGPPRAKFLFSAVFYKFGDARSRSCICFAVAWATARSR